MPAKHGIRDDNGEVGASKEDGNNKRQMRMRIENADQENFNHEGLPKEACVETDSEEERDSEYDEDEDEDEEEADHDSENEESDEGPEELDAERFSKTITINGNKEVVTFKIWFQLLDYEGNPEWIEDVHASVTSSTGAHIGGAIGRLIKRGHMNLTFWQDLESISEDLCALAFTLFNRYGCLKNELMSHPVRKGSGVWGEELDIGSFLTIERVWVEKSGYGRHGIGSFVVQKMIEKSKSRKLRMQFALMWPTCLNTRDEMTSIEEAREHDAVVSWARKNGFRRIGSTSWFGLSLDENHKARRLHPSDDYNPRETKDDLDDEHAGTVTEDAVEYIGHEKFTDYGQKRARRRAREKKKYPLHFASKTLCDEELVAFFNEALNNTEFGLEWTKLNHVSESIVHLVARKALPKSLRWLFDHGKAEAFLEQYDASGYTPLEALQGELEESRAFKQLGMRKRVCPDDFQDFTNNEVESLALLQFGPSGPSKLEADKALAQRIRFGCTCGQCIDGILSPRTHYTLLAQSEILFDMLNDSDDGFISAFADDFFESVPPHVRVRFETNKSLRQGFIKMLGLIPPILRAKQLPTVATLADFHQDHGEWPPHINNYLRAGGSFDSAITAVFNISREQDWMCGDGTFMDAFGADMLKLPKCRNDSEYGVLARLCGAVGYRHGHEYVPWKLGDPIHLGMLSNAFLMG